MLTSVRARFRVFFPQALRECRADLEAQACIQVSRGRIGVGCQIVIADDRISVVQPIWKALHGVPVPVSRHLQYPIAERASAWIVIEAAPRIVHVAQQGRYRAERVTHITDHLRVRKVLINRIDPGGEGWVLRQEVLVSAMDVQVPLHASAVERHDPVLVRRRCRAVEVNEVPEGLWERKQMQQEYAREQGKKQHLVFLGLKKADLVDLAPTGEYPIIEGVDEPASEAAGRDLSRLAREIGVGGVTG